MIHLKIGVKIIIGIIVGILALIFLRNPSVLGGLFNRLLGLGTSEQEDKLKDQIQEDKKRIEALKNQRKADQRQNAGVEQAIENLKDRVDLNKSRLKQVKNQQYNDILGEWNRRNS